MHSLKSQSVGLSMIVGTLMVIAIIAYQSLNYQKTSRTDNLQQQGKALAQLISEVPADELDEQTTRNALKILQESLARSDLAYAVVVSSKGVPLSQITTAGITPPAPLLSSAPSTWTGERKLDLENGRSIMEFYAPFLIKSEYKGSVQIGLFEPELSAGFEQLSFLASMALPVFLLAPLFYFLMSKQLQPLQKTQREIAAHLQSGAMQNVEVSASGELGEFMDNFNAYFREASNKIQTLEHDNHSMLASSKVLNYKFNRIESVIEALPGAVLVFDASGSLMFANSKVATLLGVDPNVALEQPVASWCPNDDIFRFLARCSDPANRAIPELRVDVESGNTRKQLNFNAYPLFASANDARSKGNLVIIRDASREVAAESSREEFVAHISHELKTPLNTLMMYSEALLGEDGRDEEFRTQGLNVIFDEAERMAGLISNLLSITKIEMGSLNIDRQRVKFNEFIEDTFSTIEKGSGDSGLNFQLQLPDDGIPVAIDKDLMRIAVNNLLTNAVKYNRPGGTVSLDVEDLDDAVRITVRDTGIGISSEDLEHVFDKFYRSDSDEVRERTGHGLGLSLAYDIVQLHNGRLSVTSEINEGTQFTLELFKESDLLRNAS
ncbi:MAG: sensor histidine kinase [Pseudomonadales bacterium]